MSTLRNMALKYGTDKGGHHEYCEAYEFFLSGMRDKTFNMIEIGIGGAENPDKGGASLRMWFEYFWKARIYAIDIHKKNFKQPRTYIYQGSQDDKGFIEDIVRGMNEKPKLIIDDASHHNETTIKTFFIAFPLLASGGIYVVEDVHTSYWMEHYGGGLHTPVTSMEYFKQQADYLNHDYWQGLATEPPYHEKMEGIESIHFFREIIFIRKK